jgi:hypothetical protein
MHPNPASPKKFETGFKKVPVRKCVESKVKFQHQDSDPAIQNTNMYPTGTGLCHTDPDPSLK